MRLALKKLATAALMMVFSGAASFAATVPASGFLGSFSGAPGSSSAGFFATTSGGFNDLYSFDLANDSNVVISITTTYTNSAQVINNFDLSLYHGALGTGSPIDGVTATNSPYAGPNSALIGSGTEGGSVADLLGYGMYSFRVSGTSSDTPSYGGSISISVSAVPLPASLPMLGCALLGLGIFGYRTKRKAFSAS